MKTQNLSYGLLGESLAHSYSPQIHHLLAPYSYKLFPVPRSELDTFMTQRRFLGLNVTIPYKEIVIPYCDTISPYAQEIGAVNTITVDNRGMLHGYNTDAYGFTYLCQQSGISIAGRKVLVLGSGGASKTVTTVLKKMKASEIIVISRKGPNTYDTLFRHYDAEIIVNATPVGMYPQNGLVPLCLEPFRSLKGVLELIYNPLRTALLLDAEERGIPCANGLPMLTAQAAQASELFTGKKFSDEIIYNITRSVETAEQNIILIGMPGSGKSTIGRLLSNEIGRKHLDTDDIIEQLSSKSAAELLQTEGEESFRNWEAQAVASACRESRLVISTGGGAPLRIENQRSMRQNGTLFFLDRNLDALDRSGRPLSQSPEVIQNMYKQRLPIYRALSDFQINNDRSPEDAVRDIRSALGI